MTLKINKNYNDFVPIDDKKCGAVFFYRIWMKFYVSDYQADFCDR